MVPKAVFVVVLVCAFTFCCGNDGEKPQPPPKTTLPPTTEITTPPPSTTNGTTPPTPPTKPTTPPTKPTTPPTEPTTPPTKPTTPPTKPTTPPTPAPTPTPTPSPTPSPSPKPKPVPGTGNWNVTDNNVTCIVIDMAIQLNVSYVAKNNETKYGIMDVPSKIAAAGYCGNDTQVFNLTWFNPDESSNTLILTFAKDNTSKHFMISMINLTVTPTDPEVFPDIKDKDFVEVYTNKSEFSTTMDKSYRCDKVQSIDLRKEGNNVTVATMDVSHVQLEAFHTKKDRSFGAVEDCEGGGSSPDIVPIAVGCALVGLVAIVLIAYLVGRRRSQARGYLSM